MKKGLPFCEFLFGRQHATYCSAEMLAGVLRAPSVVHNLVEVRGIGRDWSRMMMRYVAMRVIYG